MHCFGAGIGHQDMITAGCQVQFSIQKTKNSAETSSEVSALPSHADLTKCSSSLPQT